MGYAQRNKQLLIKETYYMKEIRIWWKQIMNNAEDQVSTIVVEKWGAMDIGRVLLMDYIDKETGQKVMRAVPYDSFTMYEVRDIPDVQVD